MAESNASKIVLGPDCWIKGQLHVGGDLQLHGQCDGTVYVGGTLDVRETATLKGLARAGAVRVAGKVEADLVGEQGIALLEGCHVTGRIFSPRLLAVKGATVRAEVCIGPDALAQAPGQNLSAIDGAPTAAEIDEVMQPDLAEKNFQPVADHDADHDETNQDDISRDHADDAEEMLIATAATDEPAKSISVAAALDDADEVADAGGAADEPAEQAAAQTMADISTVPHSIRSVLQRRPRLSSLASQPRRTA